MPPIALRVRYLLRCLNAGHYLVNTSAVWCKGGDVISPTPSPETTTTCFPVACGYLSEYIPRVVQYEVERHYISSGLCMGTGK